MLTSTLEPLTPPVRVGHMHMRAGHSLRAQLQQRPLATAPGEPWHLQTGSGFPSFVVISWDLGVRLPALPEDQEESRHGSGG